MTGGFTFNKALGAGIGGVVFGTLGPWMLELLHFIQPVAAAVNPVLGVMVGVLTFVVTYLTPKNADPELSSS